MRITTIALLAALLLSSGCKWRKEAERLGEALAATEATLSTRDQALADRERTLADLERERDALQASLRDLEASVEGLEADLDAERERSARMISDRGALRDEIGRMKQAVAELEVRREQAEERVAAYRDLVGRFQGLIDAGKLDVKIVDGRMVVVMNTDILFPSGSADLSAEGSDAVREVAEVLAAIPDRRYQVEGHTDDVPIRSARYPSNWFLAAARAIGVVQRMVEAGLPAEVVSAAAFADTAPVAGNDTADGRALNRRIEIVVVPDLSDLPGYDELARVGDEDGG